MYNGYIYIYIVSYIYIHTLNTTIRDQQISGSSKQKKHE